ncbi:MAG TPA: MFS transporter [Pseudonocardiaceae bacterium]|nr:MFS transporter [Pseudonocardiaceae bacterium]
MTAGIHARRARADSAAANATGAERRAVSGAVSGAGTGAVSGADRHQRSSPGFRRITLALFAAGLATFTALYCVQALLPSLATQFHLAPATASLVVSVSTAALAVGVIPLTALSEALGRTPVMTVSLFAAAGLGVLAAFSPNFTVLLVIRGLQGLALAGLQAVAMSYLAEELHRGSLGFGMGLYVAGNGIGGMIGRLLAGLVDDVSNWRWALGVVGVVALACALIFRFSILPSAHFVARPLRVRPLAASVGKAFADSGLLRLYAAGFLLMGCFVTVYNYLGFRLLGPGFDLPEVVVGLIFVVYLAGCLASAFAGRLVDRFGRPRLLWVMAVITLVGLALMLPADLALVITGLVITTAGFFAAHAIASGWVSARSARLGVQGSAVYLFCYYLGSSIGGSVGGLFFTGSGWSGLTAYTGAFVLLVIGIALALRHLAPVALPQAVSAKSAQPSTDS